MKRPHGKALLGLAILLVLLSAGCTAGEPGSGSELTLNLDVNGQDQPVSDSVQILVLLTTLALIPILLILMTAFVRIVVVLSILRTAIGVPQLPPNQVVISLAMILTFFVMTPIWTEINDTAIQPWSDGEIDQQQAVELAIVPLRGFMFDQVRESDLALFLNLAGLPRPNDRDAVPTHVLVPAFVISELQTAFQMAFVIYVPFLVIDMVVSSTLLAMGMMMLPPTVISLPFKLLLFVLVDGWHLIVQSLVLSFGK